MRTKNRKRLIIHPRWEGIDFSSDEFAALDQEITSALNEVVARHPAFAHTRHFDTFATQRRAAQIDDSSVNKGSQ